jgi:hypothetical protein
MMRSLSFVAILLLPGFLSAQTRSYEVTVSPGKHDRHQTPVRVSLVLPRELAGAPALLEDSAGKNLACQLTRPGLTTEPANHSGNTEQRDLHFILSDLKAGATIRLKLIIGPDLPKTSSGFSWSAGAEGISELRFDKRPVLRYVHPVFDDSTKEKREETYKVFHHLFDPAGERLVTKGPGGLYTHHRGLFYGFNKITYADGKKADIWHCTGDTFQEHVKILSSEAGPVLGRQRVELAWHGQGKEVFAREERELTVYAVPGGTLVEFASRLRTAGESIKLDGDPQHAGFHFRADNEVADRTKNETIFVRPDGPGEPGKTRNWPADKDHVNLPWNAMSFVLGQQRYSAAYLDRPTNPKEARCSEREYGRIGSYFEYEVTRDKPLLVNYRIWLQTGMMKGDEIASLSAAFVEPFQATVK